MTYYGHWESKCGCCGAIVTKANGQPILERCIYCERQLCEACENHCADCDDMRCIECSQEPENVCNCGGGWCLAQPTVSFKYCTNSRIRGKMGVLMMANKNYRQHRLIGEDGKEYVDVETIAPMLGRCEETVRRLARSGEIPSLKYGRRFWFHLPTVAKMRYLKNQIDTYRSDLQSLGF